MTEQQFKLSDELFEERINLYLNEHKEEILEMIDAKIATAVKKQITQAFKDDWQGKSPVVKYLYDKVETQASDIVDHLEIDKEELEEMIMKKVKSKVKKLDIQIG